MIRKALRVGLPSLALLLPSLLLAADPQAKTETKILKRKVTEVLDGDTLILQVEKDEQVIELAGMDAPEDRQPFGKEAAVALADKVVDKTVEVLVLGQQPDGELLGVVYVDGDCVNTVMVEEGWAWYYARHTSSQVLRKAQEEAKKEKRGLWKDPNATPPWIWVRTHPRGSTKKPVTASRKASPKRGGPPRLSPALGYWLNTSSGVRHNPWCRYYRRTNYGRPCGPTEGKPCRICGG